MMSIRKCFFQCHRKVQNGSKKSGLKIVRIEERCFKYHVHQMLNLDLSYCVIHEIGGVLLEDTSPQDVSQSFCSAHRLLSL